MDDGPRTLGRARRGALLGVALCLGWILHDAAMFLERGSPDALLALLPGSLIALAVGGSLGALLVRPRAAVLVLALTAGASLLPALATLPLSAAERWLPRAGFLLVLAHVLVARIAEGWLRGRGALSLGLLVGVLVCAAKTAARHSTAVLPDVLVLSSAGAALVVLLARGRLAAVPAAASLGIGLVPLVLASAERRALPRPDLAPATASAGPDAPSLLLVVLDTLRADRLATYGYERETTPRLDAFARDEATVFTAAHATSPWTLPSHASLLTGLLPAQHGARNARGTDEGALRLAIRPAQPLRSEALTLAERLRERGYRTGAVVANCAYLDHRFGLDQGFERYDDRVPTYVYGYLALAQLGGGATRAGHLPYRDADTITGLALDWLDERREPRPFFLLLNYMEAHEPYLPCADHDEAFGGGGPTDPLKVEQAWWPLLYDRALLHLDRELGRLLDGLRERGLLEDTLVVVTSDHGQGLGDHGFDGHAWSLHAEQIRIPLLVRPPGGREVARDEAPIDLAQLHDRILAQIGLEPAPAVRPFAAWAAELYAGQASESLRELLRSAGEPVEADQLAWADGTQKWIVASTGEVRAYDLERDPGELSPLPLSEAERAGARAHAEAWWRAHPARAPAEGPIDPELERRLEALGYGGR